ncbi:MAG: sigma-70 family RNA polymerase sigma factor [Ruminococcus sp.]|nr:sigma-70 family RNA polymerase sigma factor [Ruminococcus sp.]
MQPDTELINSNRKKKIEQIVRKYADMIFRIAYHNLGNFADAEDILQEVSVAIVTCNAPLDEEEYLRFWLCRVTINKCRNFRKISLLHSTEELTEDIPAAEKVTAGVLEELQKLPQSYRNVLYLYYYEGFSIEEIGKILRKSSNTIGSQLRRGREKLKKILIDGGYDEYV